MSTRLNIPAGEIADSSDDGFGSFVSGTWTVDETGFTVAAADVDLASVSLLKNPKTQAVYRWAAEEHISIDPVVGETLSFNDLPGSQGVLVK